MVDLGHLRILKQGVDKWNTWREALPQYKFPECEEYQSRPQPSQPTKNSWLGKFAQDRGLPRVRREFLPDLSGADLTKAKLYEINLSGTDLARAKLYKAYLGKADLTKANLTRACLRRAKLTVADLTGACLKEAELNESKLEKVNLTGAHCNRAKFHRANLKEATFIGADLSEADLSGADLAHANLTGANLTGANLMKAGLFGATLNGANLTQAILVDTNVEDATLTDCKIHGISVWNLREKPKETSNLHITRDFPPYNEPAITVDNLEVAQFIYMLIKYEKLRDVISAVTSKVVLILGRFTEERLAVLKALQEELRQYTEDGKAKYIPVMFDFDPDKANQDFLDTVKTIASMSRFIIADITSPTGVLVELASIIPNWKVPIKLLLDTSTGERPVAMLQPFTAYSWLVRSDSGKVVSGYKTTQELCGSIGELIGPIEQTVDRIRKAKAEEELGVENLGGGNA